VALVIERVDLGCASNLMGVLISLTAAIAVIRAGGERPFATYKSRYGLARTRFMGLAKNMTAYGIAAIAHNLRKGANFLTLYGLPDPNYAG